MTYVQGFVIPSKTEDKQAYLDMATNGAPVFADYGATTLVETWADDLPDGKITDMKKAVLAEPGEAIVFSWIFYPDKHTCDEAGPKMMADPRMDQGDKPMPFDMNRMIYAGFDVVVDIGGGRPFGYVDAAIAAVPSDAKEAFVTHGEAMAALLIEKGATRLVDGWGAEVPEGRVTDFQRAVQAGETDTVTFGWIEWPDKATRDAAWGALMSDARMRESTPPWNGPTAIFGGFTPILDTDHP